MPIVYGLRFEIVRTTHPTPAIFHSDANRRVRRAHRFAAIVINHQTLTTVNGYD